MRLRQRGEEIGRPGAWLEDMSLDIEHPQARGVECGPLSEIDTTDQRRRLRRRLPPRIGARERHVRSGVQLIARDVKRQVHPRELAVELLCELRRARAQARAHAFALGVADLPEPAVLQRRDDCEHDQEDGTGEQLPWSLAHEPNVCEKLRRFPRLYISYKTIAER